MKILLILLMMTMHYPGKRQVLIFYGAGGEALKDKQLALLHADKAGLAERDIELQTYTSSATEPEAGRRHIKPNAPFTFLLIGKDGHEAIRIDTIVTTQQLFAAIDAMPMRKQEMKGE